MPVSIREALVALGSAAEQAVADANAVVAQARALQAVGEEPVPAVLRNRLKTIKRLLDGLAKQAVSERFATYIGHMQEYIANAEAYLDAKKWTAAQSNLRALKMSCDGAVIEAQKAGVA
ncbi:hypothetical protein HY642_05365 [Candidatus Woesearchaeota archaeon]|nr:hypothetical protein [Candidatus Woesearchaeota archaeon]